MFQLLLSFFLVGSAYGAEIQTVKTVAGEMHTGYLGIGDIDALDYLPLKTDNQTLPDSFDWRTVEGIVTKPKNQGQCGSCVSFATMGMLESAAAIHGQTGLDLSEQNMLDCRSGDAFGCNGAYLSAAGYTTNGVSGEEIYPYKGRRGRCQSLEKAAKSEKAVIIGSPGRRPTADQIKKALIDYGPLMVSVYAGGSGWSGRTGRVTSCRRTSSSNHAILLVGYNKDGWIFKNSWGTSWGAKGFSEIGYGCDGFGSEAVALLLDK